METQQGQIDTETRAWIQQLVRAEVRKWMQEECVSLLRAQNYRVHDSQRGCSNDNRARADTH